MEQFLQNIVTVEWWLSVVFVGVLLNVFSNYLIAILNKLASRLSSVWRRKLVETTAANNLMVDELRNNHHLQWLYYTEETKVRFASLHYFFLGLFLIVLSPLLQVAGAPRFLFVFLMFVGTVNVLIAMKAHSKATRMRNNRVMANEDLIRVHKKPSYWEF